MATVAYEQKRMLRIGAVAARLDCSESTVRRLIANGQLPAVQLGGPGHSLRIPERELEKWLLGVSGRKRRRSNKTHQMHSTTAWAKLQDLKAKQAAGEPLTEQDVEFLRRLVDWLDAKSLEEEGFPQEWAT
jgi:excisionase family DNA binding protein